VHGPSPHLSGLNGVAAISAKDAWAVGDSDEAGPLSMTSRTLIEHWNGSTWTPVSSPAGSGSLSGLAVVSARDPVNATVIEQWNGKTWKQIPGSP
jgi:hypothetical protein